MDAIDKIRAFLDATGTKPADLARMTGINDNRMGELLNRKYPLTNLQKAKLLADAIGFTLDDFVNTAIGYPPPQRSNLIALEDWELDLLKQARRLGKAVAQLRMDTGHPAEVPLIRKKAPAATLKGETPEPRPTDEGRTRRKRG